MNNKKMAHGFILATLIVLSSAMAACGDSSATNYMQAPKIPVTQNDTSDPQHNPLLGSSSIAQNNVKGAMPVSLFLKANGLDIKGESSQSSLGRADSIECSSFEMNVATSREAGSGLATGRRQYEPIVCRKRIDKSSPLLAKALVESQKIDGMLKFFRPNPNGDGTTEQYFTVEIKNGRISSLHQYLPDTLNGGKDAGLVAPMEEIAFTFQSISWTYSNGGVVYEDSFNNNR